MLEAGKFIVLCGSRDSFVARYGKDTINSIGDLRYGLSSKGELIRLYDSEGFLVDSLTYQGIGDETPDTAFTLSLVHPDSLSNKAASMVRESPGPGIHSRAYKDYLKLEADKRYWTRIYYIGGGSFFFILVVGLWYFRFYKRKKKKTDWVD